MIGMNEITICPAEMRRAMQMYIDNLLFPNQRSAKVESVQQLSNGSFMISVRGALPAPKGAK